ncbi:MAG: hypothetical protein IJO65_14030 [Lachnospiraceae bacterium]|nr:hypothetical protein [Lachnospiraceae bacterium]
MKRILGTFLIVAGTMGWWGFVYPDLCLTPETCEQEETQESTSGGEISEIRIKSRLYEYVCQIKKKG